MRQLSKAYSPSCALVQGHCCPLSHDWPQLDLGSSTLQTPWDRIGYTPLDLRKQQPLSEAFRTVLLQRPQLQIVVPPCMVEGHSIWQFQADGKESYPRGNCRQSILRCTFDPARRSGNWHPTYGIAAWQSCQQLQIVKLPSSVISLAEGTFMGCCVLREAAAPGCVQYSQRVFAECCSLGSVGVSHETEDSRVLAPGAAWQICFRELPHAYNHHL